MHTMLSATKCWFHLKFPEFTDMKHLYKKVGHIKRKKKNLCKSGEAELDILTQPHKTSSNLLSHSSYLHMF